MPGVSANQRIAATMGPYSLPAAAGPHKVSVKSPDFGTQTMNVNVQVGKAWEVTSGI